MISANFNIPLIIKYLVLLSYSFLSIDGTAPVNSIPMKVINHAGAPIELFWINPNEGSLVLQTTKPIRNTTDTVINSYNGHLFLVRFHKDTGAEGYFKKGPSEENIFITYDEESNTLQTKQVTKFNEIMDMIDEAVKSTCNDYENEEFSNCITNNIMTEVDRIIDATKELKKYRDIMANRLVDYICNDQIKINESIAIKTELFTNKIKDKKSTNANNSISIDILSETERSKIWIVKDFISDTECFEINKNGLKILDSTSVDQVPISIISNIDGSITTSTEVLSNKNKFLNNSIYSRYVLDEDYPEQDPLWSLYSRIHELTNQITKFNLQSNSSEKLEVTHFSSTSQFKSLHCDHTCHKDDQEHQIGDRVATVMMFCKAPDEGGLILFPKSDVIIKPTLGMGIFFSYKDENTVIMDDGYTEYTSCPISQGDSSIVTLRMRL